MGRLLFIIILLAWEPELFAQVPMDSVYTFEKEDSLGLLSIKPVRKYKKLVKQIVERLQQDLQQKHGARKYRIDATFRVDTFPSFSASCIFPVAGDNGLEVIDAIENPMERNDMMEDFHYKGSYVLTVQDSTKIKGNLLAFLSFSPAYKEPRFSLSYPTSPFDSYEAIIFVMMPKICNAMCLVFFVHFVGCVIKYTYLWHQKTGNYAFHNILPLFSAVYRLGLCTESDPPGACSGCRNG